METEKYRADDRQEAEEERDADTVWMMPLPCE